MDDTIETSETETSNTATVVAQSLLVVGLVTAVAVTGYKIFTLFSNKEASIEDLAPPEPMKTTPKKTPKKTTE